MPGAVYVLNFLLCICNNVPSQDSHPSPLNHLTSPYLSCSPKLQWLPLTTRYQKTKLWYFIAWHLNVKIHQAHLEFPASRHLLVTFLYIRSSSVLSLCLGWAQMLPLPRRVLTRYPWPKDLSLLWLLEQFFLFFFLFLFRAAPMPYGSSQARGRSGATAADLHHSHSNMGSEPHLQPTPQVTATPDPQPTEWGQGSNLCPHGY